MGSNLYPVALTLKPFGNTFRDTFGDTFLIYTVLNSFC